DGHDTSEHLPGFPTPIDDRILGTTRELADECALSTSTITAGYHLGCWGIATIFNGSRSSSATSYLGPRYAQRNNLDVVLNTRVTRVLPKKKESSGNVTKRVVPRNNNKKRNLQINAIEVATTADGEPDRLVSKFSNIQVQFQS
ncbi:hypothetical protein MPER_00739, partial [Moniliophthora perniciosa FA553]